MLEPAYGTILIRTGTPKLVRDAILSHASLVGKEFPHQVCIAVTEESCGIVVRFPNGAPPYEIVNLIGWLNDPPEIDGVSQAKGWITSPATRVRYSLTPELDNPWGDTLVGASSDGKSVRVYLPEATMCEISKAFIADNEPDIKTHGAELTFSVEMDFITTFGNPDFRITHQKDTDWNQL